MSGSPFRVAFTKHLSLLTNAQFAEKCLHLISCEGALLVLFSVKVVIITHGKLDFESFLARRHLTRKLHCVAKDAHHIAIRHSRRILPSVIERSYLLVRLINIHFSTVLDVLNESVNV